MKAPLDKLAGNHWCSDTCQQQSHHATGSTGGYVTCPTDSGTFQLMK